VGEAVCLDLIRVLGGAKVPPLKGTLGSILLQHFPTGKVGSGKFLVSSPKGQVGMKWHLYLFLQEEILGGNPQKHVEETHWRSS
jgi:hypothetical protein